MMQNPDKMPSPFIPMAAIGGNPDRQTLEETLVAWRKVGVTQFMIYARSGLAVPYMSDRWLDICQDITEIAAGLNMKVWLYDDFNWPSGRCNGQVTDVRPEYLGWALDINLNDLGDINVVRGRTADILSPAAVDRFIELTHERYADRLSAYFGTVIRGFFTDEPSPIHNCRLDEAGNVEAEAKGHLRLPYYRDLSIDYKWRTGRPLLDDITAHFEGKSVPELWPDYFALIGERMRTVFVDKISDWCRQRGLHSTGHFLMEGSATSAVYANGDLLGNLTALTLPGMDEIGTNTAFDSVEFVTFASLEAAARKNGGAMAELFALGPSDMPLSRMRQMVWLAAFFGVDHYLLASPDAHGNYLKTAYYNPNNRVQPWFEALSLLGENAARAARLARSTPAVGIAVRYPRSLAARQAWGMRNSAFTPQEPPLRTLLMTLSAEQYPWALVEEDDPADSFDVVVAFTGEGFAEEKTGRAFAGIDEFIAWLADNLNRPAVVLSPQGGLARDLLVKTFEDGVTAVLDLRDEAGWAAPRSFILRDAGGDRDLWLPHRGVAVLAKGEAAPQPEGAHIPIPDTAMDLALQRPNSVRCVFSGPRRQWTFEAKKDIGDVRILMLAVPDTLPTALDGEAVTATDPCDTLPVGLRELYRTTGPMTFTKGRHTLSLMCPGFDYPFLPRVLIEGPFGVWGDELDALPRQVTPGDLTRQGLEGYAGGLTLRREITVPENATAIEMDTHGLYTAVSMGGQSLGERAWEPFAWAVPSSLRGRTVTLTVTQWTSIRPLFGDSLGVARQEKTPDCAWVADRFLAGMGGGLGADSLRWLTQSW